MDPSWLLSGRGYKYCAGTSGPVADQEPSVSVRLPDALLRQISESPYEGHLFINMTWKKST